MCDVVITSEEWQHISILIAQHAREFSKGTSVHSGNVMLWEKIQPLCNWSNDGASA